MLKKFPSEKVNDTKNALFFLLRAPTHYSFTFNLSFLYKQKHKIRLSKTVGGIYRFRFVFIKVYIFLFNKMCELFDFKTLYFLSKLK